jgi:hypothetical protein
MLMIQYVDEAGQTTRDRVKAAEYGEQNRDELRKKHL